MFTVSLIRVLSATRCKPVDPIPVVWMAHQLTCQCAQSVWSGFKRTQARLLIPLQHSINLLWKGVRRNREKEDKGEKEHVSLMAHSLHLHPMTFQQIV